MNMQVQLKSLSVPPCMKVQKELLSMFGVTIEGHSTKELTKAKVTTKTKAEAATMKASGKDKGTVTQTETEKGSRKGPVKKKVEVVSSDEEDEDEDGDGDDGDDGSEDDGSEVDDITGKKRAARALIRQQDALRKYSSLIAKNEEWSEIYSLLINSKPDGRTKVTVAMDFETSPPNFSEPWTKLSRLPNDTSSADKRGVALIEWTAWEWKNLTAKTFSRVMRILAAAAIAEASVIILYRHELLLCHPNGGAATVRIQAQKAVEKYLQKRDAGQTSRWRQTTLKDILGSASQGAKTGDSEDIVLTEGKLPPEGCVTWADGIYVPEGKDGPMIHIVEDQLARLAREQALGVQERMVQKAIDGLQNLRVAWHDPTGRAVARENPLLDDDVASAIRSLVYVSRTFPDRRVGNRHGPSTDLFIAGVQHQCVPTTYEGNVNVVVRP